MLKVGITGGIGSGKTTVCRVFETLGIPVFYADEAAKQLMETDPELVAGIQALFGDEAYHDGRLDRAHLSSRAFTEPGLLQQLNALVHPSTIAHGQQWLAGQTTPYAIKEAALFFESGTYTEMDVMVCVTAPLEVRIQRAMQRDGASRAAVEARIARQLDADEKARRSQFLIVNDGHQAVLPQVLHLHTTLLQRASLQPALP